MFQCLWSVQADPVQCWGSLQLCTSQTRELLTPVLWIRQKIRKLSRLRTMVSFWKLADLKKSLSFCAGHICSGVDDEVSEPNFNWNLFLTSLPVSQVCAITSLTLKYLQSSEQETSKYNEFLQFHCPDRASVVLRSVLLHYTEILI